MCGGCANTKARTSNNVESGGDSRISLPVFEYDRLPFFVILNKYDIFPPRYLRWTFFNVTERVLHTYFVGGSDGRMDHQRDLLPNHSKQKKTERKNTTPPRAVLVVVLEHIIYQIHNERTVAVKYK